MRPSPTPWSPPLRPRADRSSSPRGPERPALASWPGARGSVLAAGVLLLALSTACVTRGAYEQVEAQRDRLAAEREALAARVERLEASNQSLDAERVELFEELEDLRQRREALERDLHALREDRETLEEELAAADRRLADQREALAAQEAAMRELQQTYDGLVTELQADVEAGRMAVERLREGIAFRLPDDVVFPPGAVEPTAEGRAVVRRLAERLAGGEERIEVHGHTDSLPVSRELARRFPSNWELAAARAAAVVRLLVDEGVDPARLTAVSHGAHDPVASNDTPEGRARNRRIEVRLIPPLEAPGAEAPPPDPPAP